MPSKSSDAIHFLSFFLGLVFKAMLTVPMNRITLFHHMSLISIFLGGRGHLDQQQKQKEHQTKNKKRIKHNKGSTQIFLDRPLLLLALWSAGPLVLWSFSPLVHRSFGPLVPWSLGPLVHRPFGPLVLWSWSG